MSQIEFSALRSLLSARIRTFPQPIHEPIGEMKEHYTKCQEGARIDVERAFGVLQARFEIVKNPVRQWDLGTIEDIMLACIIMHNMIIEDEQGLLLEYKS
jgi:hypothetical protein